MKLPIVSFKRLIAGISIVGGLAFGAQPALSETLKVGVTATGIPFTFLNVQTNTIQGMMVDTAHAVAKEAGFDVSIDQNVFSALIPALTSKKIDIISAAMLKTPARAEVVDFSDPVYSYGEGLVVKADDTGTYRSLDDLKGAVVGAQVGTVFIDMLKAKGYFKEVRSYDSVADMMRDIALGRIKAGIGDQPIVAYQIEQGTFKGVRLSPDYKPTNVGDVCLVVRKGEDALLNRLNEAIAKIKADGTLKNIIAKWGI
jgi:ABC-type amino acid transport/signal transduction systems, periplasmic component/domain